MVPDETPLNIAAHPLLGDWASVRSDGIIELYSGKVELGQGISAALERIACTQLGVEPDQVELIAGDTLRCPDEGWTSGSQSIEVGGSALRHACRRLRQCCAAEAARRLSVPVESLTVARGVFVGTGAARVSGFAYADLAQALDLPGLRLDQPPPPGPLHPDPPLPAEALFARHDLPRKLSGAGFVHDHVLPGLLHARMLRGPHSGSRPLQVDLERLRALPGVARVVTDGGFVAIAGPDEGALVSALDAAQAAVTWRTPLLPPGDDIETLLRSLPARTSTAVQQGQPLPAAQRLRQSYSRPFIAHAAIGPSCAVAAPAGTDSNDPVRLTVWSHTQGPHKLRDQIARALGLAAAQVRVVHEAGSGCYGHNGADDVAFDAACLAQLLQAPVRVQWTRREEFSVAPMGPASLVEIDAGLTADGHIAEWQVQVWSPSHVSRPGAGQGINLLGAWARAAAMAPSAPADVPLPTGGGLRNAVPGYVLPALQVVHHFIAEPPLRVSALRSLGAHANVFAIESFIDELAAAAAVDPVEFRLRHLSDERARHVVLRAAQISAWSQRPAGGDGHGLGFGYARYKNHAGYCAVVVAVRAEDQVWVERVWAVVDAGAVVHRDGLLNQIEGGIVQALSWSLKEAVAWGPEGISSASWDDYPILGFDEVPAVEVELVDRPDAPSLGCGELAAGPVAGALGNAVAHALGLRARHLPLTPQRLLQLVNATSA